MNRGRRGFTILELLIVLTVSGVLVGIISLSFSRVHSQLAVQASQTAFFSLHAQARAFAVERGAQVSFVVDREQDEFRVEWTNPTSGEVEVLNRVSVRSEYDVDVITRIDDAELCFTPRGLADPGCNNFSGTLQVDLQRGNRTASLTLLQLGQALESP